MPKDVCPFEEGDRVDHRLFGLGTVVGAPVAMVGPDLHTPYGVRDAGWTIPVRFDDPARSASRIGHTALAKVSSPDTRPYGYWSSQWRLLVDDWKRARRAIEEAYAEFRPPPSPEKLSALQKEEVNALAKLNEFLEADRNREQ